MDTKTALSLYERMLMIRRFEEKLFELFSTRVMPGTMHQYNGQEAVAVGVCSHLRDEDYITSTHRGHGHCIAKGADLNAVMAEMFAKTTGCCKGLGGSMHIADFGVGMLGANGIVGGGIPMAVGAGWSCQYRRTDNVSVAFFGDGAANEGAFHEALNLAATWSLPVIFVCENNLYGFSTHYARTLAVKDIADRAVAYGMPGGVVDGMDVEAVHAAAGEAVDRARAGDGPTLLECKTYRFRGHSRFEDPSYRTKEELAQWRKRDPIDVYASRLSESYGAEADAIETLESQVREKLEAAVRFAETSPDPQPEDYRNYIYA
jgi:pyruvate dehydrogenase E1 component alpha subunit